MNDRIYTLTVRAAGQDDETAIFTTQDAAERAAIAAVDPYETGEFERAVGQAGAVVFLTPEGADDEAEARVTPAEPTPAQRAQLRTDRAEDLHHRELQSAIDRARALLDRTEEWAARWHEGESATPPFSVGGLFQASDLTEVALRAHTYRASAEAKAEA